MRLSTTLFFLAVIAWPGAPRAQSEMLPTSSPSAEAPAEPSTPIALRSPDQAIHERLLQLYREIDGLEDVRVAVRGGVVTLTGVTLEPKASSEAEQVAARVAGVVSVENEIATEHRLAQRLSPLVGQAEAMGAKIIAFLPLLAVALVVFALFWIAGVVFTRRTNIFRRLAPNPFVEALLEQVVRLLFIVAGLVVAMSILGATALIGSVLGAAGVLGLAVGFAMRNTIENYIAGILLSIRQPFRPNDAVLIEGIEGRITTLNSRATIITTWDGNEVRIPNTIVYQSMIKNYTHTPQRRFDFEIRVRLDTEISCALAIALQAVKSVEGVLEEPQPASLVVRVDEYALVFSVMGWVDQTKSDFNKVKSEAIRAVKEAFDADHIRIAEPIWNMRTLPPPDPKSEGKARQPTAEEMRVIKDTSPDTTIKEKVNERRQEATNDLLTPAAPRE